MFQCVMFTHWSLLFILIYASSCDAAAFEVRVPEKQMVAVYGSPAILQCSFTPPPSLQDVIITWQTEDKRVVHSFYYGTDQLERQSPAYKGRTSLYHDELQSGNASLRLTQAGFRDAGGYLCSVSTSEGTDKAEMQLSYAAFFSEPRLTILPHDSGFTLQYESEGYPKPEVQWRDVSAQNFTQSTHVLGSNENPDLLRLKTQAEVDNVRNLSWTLIVVNHPLGQVIERHASFIYDDQRDHMGCSRERLTVLCPIALGVISVIGLMILVWGGQRSSE